MKERRYPLNIYLSSLFFIFMSMIGAGVIWVGYNQMQTVLLEEAEQRSDNNRRELENAYKQAMEPVLTTLNFLATDNQLGNKLTTPEASDWRTSIASVLHENPELIALYFADINGDLTTVYPLFKERLRKQFNAPKDAILFITQKQDNGLNWGVFYNRQSRQISTRQLENHVAPRQLNWFEAAPNRGTIYLLAPNFFHDSQHHGVTLSRKSSDGRLVIGADFTFKALAKLINQPNDASNSTRRILLDPKMNIIAQSNTKLRPTDTPISQQAQLKLSVFAPVLQRISNQIITATVTADDQRWFVTLAPVMLTPNLTLRLAEATPYDTLLGGLISMRNQQVMTVIILLIIGFIAAMVVTSQLARTLKKLHCLTTNIAQFELSKTRYPKTKIREVAHLTHDLQRIEHTLHDLLKQLRDTAGNHDFNSLAKTITHQSFLITRAETIILYIYSADEEFNILSNHTSVPFPIDINLFLEATPWIRTQLQKGEIVHIRRLDNSMKKYAKLLKNEDMYFFPLMDHNRQLVGILNLGYQQAASQQQINKHIFLKELLGFAQITKSNIDKIQQQKEMFHTFIELIATAADTKSPYQNDQCQRVPTLSKWLTEAANRDQHYYPHFTMEESQWEELYLATWLHDCSKVSLPEYITEKATKLETIYDRIHEVRMRFELLKSQAETNFWQGIAAGKDRTTLQQELTRTHLELDDEFAFVAQCNTGYQPLSDADCEKLHQIAQRTWTRTLDDQLGISWLEKQRAGQPAPLPATEKLLDDKPVHKITSTDFSQHQESERQSPGDILYDRGEIKNLSIRRGTLTDEERAIINQHMTQTINMLKKLPYPEHLKNVPDIATSHRERMNGQGYPRAIGGEKLSVQARVIAIADIFEALTSSTRPYKKRQTLDESIKIMTEMATTGHIDPRLYLLFLEQDIYLRYAHKFLPTDQLSEVDKEHHIKQVKQYLKTLVS
jgi:HD-GYP domain-containing protein (c-di-GMP phosphodiesterase class II)/HAMP domain-containing protein